MSYKNILELKNIELIDRKVRKLRRSRYALNITFGYYEEYADKEITYYGVDIDIGDRISEEWSDGINRIDVGYGLTEYDKCIVKVVEEREEEITLKDIEKKFGHKIKIVSE